MARAKKKVEETPVETEEETGVRIQPNLENYETVKSASGKKSRIRKDDPVAESMVGFTLEQVYDVADALGIELPSYEHLNPGMQRMCIGNKIRGWINTTTKENDAKTAEGKKAGPDPLVSLNKICKPIATANAKAAKAAEKGAA